MQQQMASVRLRQQIAQQKQQQQQAAPQGTAVGPGPRMAPAAPAPVVGVPEPRVIGAPEPRTVVAPEPRDGAATPPPVNAAAAAGPTAAQQAAATLPAPNATGTTSYLFQELQGDATTAAAPAPPLAVRAAAASASGGTTTGWTPPPPNAAFQYQIGEVFKYPDQLIPGVGVYVLDGFDTPASTVRQLRAAGAYPVCYISTAYEDWRGDKAEFPRSALGKPMDDWEGERWVDVRSPAVRSVMRRRMEAQCRDKGFLAVDADNVDVASQSSGFPVTPADQAAFIRYLADTAHSLGLAYGLKVRRCRLLEGGCLFWGSGCFDAMGAWRSNFGCTTNPHHHHFPHHRPITPLPPKSTHPPTEQPGSGQGPRPRR